MKNILFSIYTCQYPNINSGGPNNIIYKLISESSDIKYKFDYLSSDLFSENLLKSNIKELKKERSNKKKMTSFLADNFSLYRKIFSSDFYLPIHYLKKNRYFNNFRKKSINYNIIHSQDSISLSQITDKKTNSKKILTVHSKGALSDELKNMFKSVRLKEKFDKKLKEYEKQSINLADVITFPSRAARKYFEESLDIELDDTKVRIIYNGIDHELIRNVKSDKKLLNKYSIEEKNYDIILLNIAAHEHEKNIDVLLKVVQKLKRTYKKKVLLINIGVGSLTDELIKLTSDLNIKHNVKYLGNLSNDEVIKFLKATDFFIMTSQKVIFDLVVLEALACGICTIVSNDGGNKEIIKDGYNGYLIDIDDVDKIAHKIITINIDKVKTNAIETAKQFSVQKMVKEYFEVYESLLDGV